MSRFEVGTIVYYPKDYQEIEFDQEITGDQQYIHRYKKGQMEIEKGPEKVFSIYFTL